MHEYVLTQLTNAYKGYGKDNCRSKDFNLHVSDLAKLCPRAYALAHSHGRSIHAKQYISMQLGWTFDMGRMMQDIVTDKLMSQGVLWGTWECIACGGKTVGPQVLDHPPECPTCASYKAVRYIDTALVLKKGRVVIIGHVDSFLITPEQRDNLLVIFPNEIKSIKSEKVKRDGFEDLEEEMRDHRYQSGFYSWMLKQKGVKIVGKPEDEKVIVLRDLSTVTYAIKGNAKMPFKSYSVSPDTQMISSTEAKLKKINKFLRDSKIPRRTCKSQAELMARGCIARALCFDNAVKG